MINPFGDIFPEEIVKVGGKSKIFIRKDSQEESISSDRIWFFVILVVSGLGILIARVFSLTIIEGGMYRRMAEGNRIRETKITSPRGIIYDRKGQALVRNIPAFIKPDGEVFFENKPTTVSGELVESVDREYIFGNLFSHVIGYIGEVDEQDLKREGDVKYQLGDKLGKMGIEKSYDEILRGKNGKQLVEVDAKGETVRILGKIDPLPGQNLKLFLDGDLQKAASENLKDKKGAVVAENPQTGEVMVLYSEPSFDPNAFVLGVGLDKILEDENEPLFDRAISGQYPPGSAFKIVTALSALSTGAIDKNTKFEDTGVLSVGQYSFGNWYFSQYGKKEGVLDIVGAIQRSNDIFFYKTGEAVGIENLALWARKIGIGKISGIDIPGEAKGLMPDPAWQKKEKGEDWYLGNTYHVAIGQGDVLTTPLQVNAWTNLIANGGKLCQPHLVKAGSGKREAGSEKCRDLGIKRETVDLIREGMKLACSPGGTGWPLFKFKVQSENLKIDGVDFLETFESTTSGKPMVEIPVACKTGTAEFGDPKGKTHAWFTVFAPIINPKISVTVLVESGGEGSSVAAPIAKKILEEYFSKERN